MDSFLYDKPKILRRLERIFLRGFLRALRAFAVMPGCAFTAKAQSTRRKRKQA
jgi:hypothetical protein